MPFRAILFDIGDTLWYSRSAPTSEEFRRLSAARVADFLRSSGLHHDDPALVARSAWNAMDEAILRARSTDLVEPDYGEVSRRAVAKVGLNLTRDQAIGLLNASYISGAEAGKAAYDDAPNVLDELRRRGFQLAVVTNRAIGGERFRSDLRDAGLDAAWDVQAVSAEVGFLKPHRAIFDYALKRLGVCAAEALMVGNSLAQDIAGAQAVGIAAAWRRSEADAEGVVPDFTFDELSELLDFADLKKSA